MITFLVENTSANQLPEQPDRILIVADSEEKALDRITRVFGKGYEVVASVQAVDGMVDVV